MLTFAIVLQRATCTTSILKLHLVIFVLLYSTTEFQFDAPAKSLHLV